MLTEERYQIILDEIKKKSIVSVSELVKLLDTSESTIRRDLNSLHKEGLLKKVHGGATNIKKVENKEEVKVNIRKDLNIEKKIEIAKYAANLIEDGDIVYIDAGTTTELMIDFIEAKGAIFVTNGIIHAKKLIQREFKTYILGGELKLITEAIVGTEAVNSIKKYNFSKGFFGTNGISLESGFTTPDINEALVKTEAINRSSNAYVLTDETKFEEIGFVTFADISSARIVTTKLNNNKYRRFTEVLEVCTE